MLADHVLVKAFAVVVRGRAQLALGHARLHVHLLQVHFSLLDKLELVRALGTLEAAILVQKLGVVVRAATFGQSVAGLHERTFATTAGYVRHLVVG